MSEFKLASGTIVQLGPLARDLPFLTRNLRASLNPVGSSIRRQLGLEGGVIGVLCIVWLNPGISQNDLAASVALKKSAVTKLVTSLEERGLVTRRRTSADRRTNALTLTAAGHELIASVRALTDSVHETLFDGIDRADREVFFRVLTELLVRLSEGHPDPAPGGDADLTLDGH